MSIKNKIVILLLFFVFSCEKGEIFFDVVAPPLTFDKRTKPYKVDGTFTLSEILEGVTGNKTGYKIKNITNLNPNDVATLSSSPPPSLTMNKIGSFTATLVLEHSEKPEVTITEAQFEITDMSTTWQKVFGDTHTSSADAMSQTTDGGYIVAGNTMSNAQGLTDAWLVKLDNNGQKQWDKKIHRSYSDVINDIIKTTDGGYIMAGYTRNYGNDYHSWVVKVDKDGHKQWDKIFGDSTNEGFQSVIQTTDGGYALTGRTRANVTGSLDLFVIKLDGNGNKQWDKIFGGNREEGGNSIIQTTDGGYIILGYNNTKGLSKYSNWLIKLNSNGDKQWDKAIKGVDNELATDMIPTADGGYALAGARQGAASTLDVWVAKLNSNGDKQWDKVFKNQKVSAALSILQNKDGSYTIAGSQRKKLPDRSDIRVLKIDKNGNKLWDKFFGNNTDIERAYDIIHTNDGGYAIAGEAYYKKTTWRKNVLVIKLDADGNL